jgi:ligand-binding SRPBCC domain-containing protein
MRLHVLRREQHLPKSPDEAFAFFGDAHNLEDITPPWLGFRVVTPRPLAMRPGTLIEYRLRLHGLPLHWRTQIAVWDPPRRFVDVQLRGPYRLWHHTHEFEPEGDGTRMTDVVRYGLPLGPLGEIAQAILVGRDVEAIFDHRAGAIPALLDGQHR